MIADAIATELSKYHGVKFNVLPGNVNGRYFITINSSFACIISGDEVYHRSRGFSCQLSDPNLLIKLKIYTNTLKETGFLGPTI